MFHLQSINLKGGCPFMLRTPPTSLWRKDINSFFIFTDHPSDHSGMKWEPADGSDWENKMNEGEFSLKWSVVQVYGSLTACIPLVWLIVMDGTEFSIECGEERLLPSTLSNSRIIFTCVQRLVVNIDTCFIVLPCPEWSNTIFKMSYYSNIRSLNSLNLFSVCQN